MTHKHMRLGSSCFASSRAVLIPHTSPSPPLTARPPSLLAILHATSNTTIYTANVCLRALINDTRSDSTSTVVHSISEIAHNGLR